jgi:hypothetical protein
VGSLEVSAQEFWIHRGGLVPRPDEFAGQPVTDKDLLSLCGFVRVMRDDSGTQVSWYTNSANFASLYFAKEWIGTFPGPYRLTYFLSGWFTEEYDDPELARVRIDQLIAKSDTLLTSRVYVKDIKPKLSQLPDLLRQAYEERKVPARQSVECFQDPRTSRFKVSRIGEESAIAQYWGLSPVSFPCLNGNSYDDIVSAAYERVIAQKQPNYSHVYAAMVRPDGEVGWIPYQRVILPGPNGARIPTVTIVSQFTPVEIVVV